MTYLLSTLLLTACDSDGSEQYKPAPAIFALKDHANSYMELYHATVTARQWRSVSGEDRFADIPVPAITDDIVKEGMVMVYLQESERTVSLPFTYYQLRRAIFFQPSYEKGHAYINILGHFILNTRDHYVFRILVISAKGLKRFKHVDWTSYKEVEPLLKVKP